jgi:hypothetical protein
MRDHNCALRTLGRFLNGELKGGVNAAGPCMSEAFALEIRAALFMLTFGWRTAARSCIPWAPCRAGVGGRARHVAIDTVAALQD